MALIKDLTVFGASRFISDVYGNITYANKYITNGGSSSQFVKGDGTLDSNIYVTSASIDSSLNSYVKKVTSTDNAIARFDGTGGQIQNSTVTVDDSGKIITSNDISLRNAYIHGSITSNDTRYITSDSANNIYVQIGTMVPFAITDQDVRPGSNGADVINLGNTSRYWNNIYAKKYIVKNGTSSQFLKADGSLDSNIYLSTSTLTQTVVKGVGTASTSFSNFAPVKYVELKSDADELGTAFISSIQTNQSPTTYTTTNTVNATATTVSTSITGTTTCVAYVKTQ